MSDPLAAIRSNLAAISSKLKGEKSVPNASQTHLLIAIAHVNGHAAPQVWAQQVTDYLAKL
jgi:hypothetical protein